jgi:hypothetical protein
MSNNKDLLYEPQIGYKKNYYTEGTFDDNNQVVTPPSQINIDNPSVPIINNLINTIDNNIKWLPKVIKDTYLSPYIVLKEEYYRVLDYPDPDPDPGVDPTPIPSTEDPDADFPPDPFIKGPDIYIDIKDPLDKISSGIPLRYKLDFLDIYKDYLEKLNVSTQNYLYTSLASLDITDKNHNLTSFASKDINNQNLLHLSDYLSKSSIRFDQVTRLHKKLFDMDATILHVRGIRLSEKLIQRYNDIKPMQNNTNLTLSSNVLLTESQRLADKKYKENFYALYKYLNSSVILMDESTQVLLKQNKSILTLNKYEERDVSNDNTTTNK